MAIKILSEYESKLLNRREVACLFPVAAGLITRAGAIKAVAEMMKADVEKVFLTSLKHRSGSRDVTGTFYLYEKLEDAKRHLSPHLLERMLPKEQRKKQKEEKKAKPQPKPAKK